MNPTSSTPIATVNEQNPWLGLVSFTEETRGYFHGREEEAAELGRRVQRKLLTVLFGQSGLGKTSILQAGLVPRLRPEGFCPVYVRLDYDPHSPPPSEQIKRAVFRATEAAGSWTQSGSAVLGETLWEFLHHRDDVLKDPHGRTLIPILIFDQFEEIFTLAQSDDAGRKRAQEFLADLADLVENRPPSALEARIERDEADAARFDFARADYRILISLREDYLAHLEGLKGRMPSVTQNRMRLARMTGAQAVAAVCAPAPHLVSVPVAEAIVRFVAGGADLAHAEVEPSLLSLICRELNNTRLSQGRAEISADLLAGSRDTILSEFYERALVDQPPGVRIFIEDEMLTDSGFRESVAEERVRKAFAAAGAAPGALALLVDRRLLRVEDRLDLRRVEITHDVLCSVIGASRGVRHEREALEESRRQLAAQQAREAATRRSLFRARLVAAVAIVVMIGAVGSAVFGFVNLRRARAAEMQTRQARLLAEQARTESEKLIGFLLEDFYEELRPTGRIEIVGKLADKAVAYYDGLPPELMTPQTRIYHGLALARKASALAESGNQEPAALNAKSSQKIFDGLRGEGLVNDETTVGLALALTAKLVPGFSRAHLEDLQTAVNLLRPLVASGRATRSARLALGDLLQFLAHGQKPGEGFATCEESRKILAGLGALDLSDLTAASIYGDVTDSQSRMAQRLGRIDEAERLAREVSEISEKVLAQRPGDLRAMRNRYFAANMLGQVAADRFAFAQAEALFRKAAEAARNYTLFNPSDSTGWRNLGSSDLDLADVQLNQGRISEGLQRFAEATKLEHDPRNRTGVDISIFQAWVAVARIEAQRGNPAAARKALIEARRVAKPVFRERMLEPAIKEIMDVQLESLDLDLLAAAGDYGRIHAAATDLQARIDRLKIDNPLDQEFSDDTKRRLRGWHIDSALRLNRMEEALTSARAAVEKPLAGRLDKLTFDDVMARNQIRLGQALLGTGQRTEACKALETAEAHFRKLQRQGANGTFFLQTLSRILFHLSQAQADDAAGRSRRLALLEEAAALMGGLTFEAQQVQTSQELARWIADDLRKARS